LDTEIFKLLKGQALEVFALLITMREFASVKGLRDAVEKIDSAIVESEGILLLANKQLSDLSKPELNSCRMGLFDAI